MKDQSAPAPAPAGGQPAAQPKDAAVPQAEQPKPSGEPGQAGRTAQPAAPAGNSPPKDQKSTITPKQKALSAAEEYAKEMKSCMEAWDSFTRMTKDQWRQTCQRTLKMRYYQPTKFQ